MSECRLIVPTRDLFYLRKAWLADPSFMSFNAGWHLQLPTYNNATGCVDWPETEWDSFEQRLQLPSSKQGYFYVRCESESVDESGDAGSACEEAAGRGGGASDPQYEFVGHAHYWVSGDVAEIGINILPSFRKRGHGHAVLGLLIDVIRHKTTCSEVVNCFEDERVAAVRLHRRSGFIPDVDAEEFSGRKVRTWRLTF